MDSNDLNLTSVNWEHGMLLTPEHFLRQERYFDSALFWILRYATAASGLVGGGPRLREDERGAVRHDPVVVVDEDDESVSISVTQCRGLTPAGCIIEIDPAHAIHRRFPKTELEGMANSCGIYIVSTPHEKQVLDGTVDEFNPQMMTERRPSYFLSLRMPAESVAYSIAVGRLRRAQFGAGFEKDAEFIPPCTSLVSYSEMTGAWRRIVEEVTLLTQRYTDLHRAMLEFVKLFKERGIETETDLETMSFVGRMVIALQQCLYEIIDPVQAPQGFFGQLRRFFHSSAVYLDLSAPVRQYFELLKETGETEFITLLEQQKKVLSATPKWLIHHDLSVEVRAALQSLAALRRLERALEGKYIDFRINPAIEAMNFVFDGGGQVLYKLAAKPSRVQGIAEELTMTFAQLRLEGRDKYRLVLAGEQNVTFETGTRITVEIRINEGSGFARPPIFSTGESKSPEQCNFEFDFEAPDVPTITDLRVVLPARYPIRTALLFARQRFYASMQPGVAQPVTPEAGVEPGQFAERPQADPDLQRRRRVFDQERPLQAAKSEPLRSPEVVPPWEAPRRGDRPKEGDAPPPPRRRRLE